MKRGAKMGHTKGPEIIVFDMILPVPSNLDTDLMAPAAVEAMLLTISGQLLIRVGGTGRGISIKPLFTPLQNAKG